MEKRHILRWLIFLLYTCNTLVTLSMDVAIVSMVKTREDAYKSNQPNNTVCPNTTFFLRNFLSDENNSKTSTHLKGEGYNWSKKEQSVVLSGYYWMNYLSALPASILAQKYGSKRVIGFTQGLASIISSLIPTFAGYGYLAVAWIRAIQGILSFMSIPAGILTIIGNWIPPQERAGYGSFIIVGSNFGSAIGNYCFGYIAEHIHWKYVFYMTSICGVIWLGLWCTLIYDEPRKHPKISLKEKQYIESSIKKSEESVKDAIPWKSVVTSIPVIVCTLAVNADLWCFVMIATYIPVYLKSMYGLNSEEIGIITSVPSLLACIVSLLGGYYCDHIIKKGICSPATTRKTSAFIGSVIAVLPLIVIALTKCNVNSVIICLLIHSLLTVIRVFGASIGIIDLSPKFCGIIEGITSTATNILTFLLASFVSYLSGILDTKDLWKVVFILTASFEIVANLLYIIFGSSKVQSWNFNTLTDQNERLNVHREF